MNACWYPSLYYSYLYANEQHILTYHTTPICNQCRFFQTVGVCKLFPKLEESFLLLFPLIQETNSMRKDVIKSLITIRQIERLVRSRFCNWMRKSYHYHEGERKIKCVKSLRLFFRAPQTFDTFIFYYSKRTSEMPTDFPCWASIFKRIASTSTLLLGWITLNLSLPN